MNIKMQRTCFCAHLLRTLTLKSKGAAEMHHMAGAVSPQETGLLGPAQIKGNLRKMLTLITDDSDHNHKNGGLKQHSGFQERTKSK